MKNYKYKNRGIYLEHIINDSNAFYLNKDIAVIYKKPTPIKAIDVSYPDRKATTINKAVFESISTLDYNGIYKGKYIEFDAKECKSTTSFPLSNIKSHQLLHMKRVINHGGITFLIILMNNKFFLLDGNTLFDFIKNNDRKSLPYDFLETNAHIIKEKYMPRIDYIEVVNKLYFKEEK